MAETALSAIARPSFRLQRLSAALAMAILGVALVWHSAALLHFGAWAIGFPYELDYGEGIVWQQMRLMFTERAYGPIDGFPAIVFHYPPVYHAAVQALATASGLDELAAGRSVSLAGIVVAAGLGGAMVFRLLRLEESRAAAAIGALVAATVMLANWPVLFWTPVMRVDMLALALGFGGAYCCILALERPRMAYAAAAAFVLAVYTKHSMIAAPAGCFAALLLLRRAVAARGIVTSIVLGLIGLLALGWVTGGGFFRHLFLYNINRFELQQLRPLWDLFVTHSLYMIVAGLALRSRLHGLLSGIRHPRRLQALRERVEADPRQGIFLVLVGYFAATLLMLPLMAKSGSNVNYLIEFICVVALFVGIAAGDAAKLVLGRGSAPNARAVLVFAALAAQVLVLPTDRFERLPRPDEAVLAQLSDRIAKAEKPVISDDMVLLIKAGHEVVWEAAIFAELASTRHIDERRFIARIDRKDFAFFITFRERGEVTFDSRYNPAVADAIDRAYPAKERLGRFTLHSPRP